METGPKSHNLKQFVRWVRASPLASILRGGSCASEVEMGSSVAVPYLSTLF